MSPNQSPIIDISVEDYELKKYRDIPKKLRASRPNKGKLVKNYKLNKPSKRDIHRASVKPNRRPCEC